MRLDLGDGSASGYTHVPIRQEGAQAYFGLCRGKTSKSSEAERFRTGVHLAAKLSRRGQPGRDGDDAGPDLAL